MKVIGNSKAVVALGLSVQDLARTRMNLGLVHSFVIPTHRQLKNMRRKR